MKFELLLCDGGDWLGVHESYAPACNVSILGARATAGGFPFATEGRFSNVIRINDGCSSVSPPVSPLDCLIALIAEA